MAFPTILVNSATGSDTAASGAGPATALTGSSASTSGTGLVVTLDGSPDLSGVAVDGSHVLYLADTTAGARNFSKITAKDDTADTVTVANAFGINLTGKSWAIGGKRASIGSTTSKKLFDNNSAAGDALPAWIVEMESGHAETIAATFNFRRAGDTTDGPITLRGTAGAATMPVLTFSNNGNALHFGPYSGGQYIHVTGIELRNSNATKTASVALYFDDAVGFDSFNNIKVSHATNYFYRYGSTASGNSQGLQFRNCEFGYAAQGDWSWGMHAHFYACRFHHMGANGGIRWQNGTCSFSDCIFDHNVGTGAEIINGGNGIATFQRCVFDANSSHGLHVQTSPFGRVLALNCDFSNNGGYGLNMNLGIGSIAQVLATGQFLLNCNFYSNTSGKYNADAAAAGVSIDEQTVNPGYTDAANGDYRIGTALKALGFPLTGIGNTATRSYMDIGAAQREEPAAGGINRAALPSGLSALG